MSLPKEPVTLTVKPYQTLFKVKTPDGDLSQTGVIELQDYLYSKLCLEGLPEDFEYTWTTNRGTLPKRVQSYYYKAHQRKLETTAISELGNIARRHVSLAQEYIMDFTNTIDWQDGAFGDGGSCFWSERTGAKTMIEENGCAVRAYKPSRRINPENGQSELVGMPDAKLEYSKVRGYARAWVSPISENRLIVFNGYGESTLTFARLLALKYNCGYKRISLENGGSDGGVLYINNGGFLIGQWSNIDQVNHWDLEWHERHGHNNDDCNMHDCYACGDEYCEDDMYNVEITAYDTPTGRRLYRWLCTDCVFGCDHCGCYTYNVNRHSEMEGHRYCNACFPRILRDVERKQQAELAIDRKEAI